MASKTIQSNVNASFLDQQTDFRFLIKHEHRLATDTLLLQDLDGQLARVERERANLQQLLSEPPTTNPILMNARKILVYIDIQTSRVIEGKGLISGYGIYFADDRYPPQFGNFVNPVRTSRYGTLMAMEVVLRMCPSDREITFVMAGKNLVTMLTGPSQSWKKRPDLEPLFSKIKDVLRSRSKDVQVISAKPDQTSRFAKYAAELAKSARTIGELEHGIRSRVPDMPKLATSVQRESEVLMPIRNSLPLQQQQQQQQQQAPPPPPPRPAMPIPRARASNTDSCQPCASHAGSSSGTNSLNCAHSARPAHAFHSMVESYASSKAVLSEASANSRPLGLTHLSATSLSALPSTNNKKHRTTTLATMAEVNFIESRFQATRGQQRQKRKLDVVDRYENGMADGGRSSKARKVKKVRFLLDDHSNVDGDDDSGDEAFEDAQETVSSSTDSIPNRTSVSSRIISSVTKFFQKLST
ncbi:hypothetical protein BDB00DRAFT_832698 [Zychaea mexicana]|uniref:uncharacterized protein n=1 Tax=Zychaea mexicana TaxID=64656 RepID=UPI0022FDC965|nr:uncharacterized protein BDB00DRAFT_832698 [Zychaea mexicana]KAI9491542.1 hypothetical protein BDB00DRAFT_832698 [Zychaea mexicana]